MTFLRYSYFVSPFLERVERTLKLNRAITMMLLTLADPCSVITPFSQGRCSEGSEGEPTVIQF